MTRKWKRILMPSENSVSKFEISIHISTNRVSSHIESIYYVYTRNVIIVCYKTGQRYAYERVSLFDFLDYLAKVEQEKSFGRGIIKFLNLIATPKKLNESELGEFK